MEDNLKSKRYILLVEDDENHAELVRRHLPSDWDLIHKGDSDDAVKWLKQVCAGGNGQTIPDLILLDWKFEGQSLQGVGVLEHLKTNAEARKLNLHRLPIVVLTTSAESKDICDAFSFYANSYIVKPKPDSAMGWKELLAGVDHYWNYLDLHLRAKPRPAAHL
jgi:CheY-like chemotaxis protein